MFEGVEPPARIALVELAAPPPAQTVSVKFPKSVALPTEAMVT